MNLKKTFAAVAMALALTAGGMIVAQEAGGGKRAHAFGRHFMGWAASELNLTDQQKEFGKQLRADTRKQAEPIVAQLKQNRTELAEAVKANNLSGIDQITQRQGVLAGQLSALHSKAMASFYAQLTPEQKAKADELRAKFKDRAARWMNRG